MTDNIIKFPGMTTVDIPPEKVLQAAIEHDLDEVVIMGFDKKGDLFLSSSTSNVPTVLWIAEKLKYELLASEQ